MQQQTNNLRKLDALVAKHVMGWHGVYFADDFSPPHWRGMSPENITYREEVPNYTTDIAAAWEVVEKLKSMTVFRDIHIEHHLDEWRVSTCYEIGEWKGWVAAETAPLAIVLASLKAVGYEGETE